MIILACDSTSGLETNTLLRNLYIQENLVRTIEGLDNLSELRSINLTRNLIYKIEGLQGCTKLETLLIASNRVGQDDEESNIDALKGLLECPSITNLDIKDNYISDPAVLPEIFKKMPNLTLL